MTLQRIAASRKLDHVLPEFTPLSQPSLDSNGAIVEGTEMTFAQLSVRFKNQSAILGTRSKQPSLSWLSSHTIRRKNCAIGHTVQRKTYAHRTTVRNRTIEPTGTIFEMFLGTTTTFLY